MAIHNELHRCAITLNNIGVQLLGKGESVQGLETVREAMDVMCLITTPNVDEVKLQTATIQAKAKIRASSSLLISLSSAQGAAGPDLHVVCWDDLQDSSALLSTPATFGIVYHVVFSLTVVIDSMSMRDYDLDASVMIYNFGMACLALQNELHAVQMNVHALALFKMSFGLLYQKIQQSLVDNVWSLDASIESVTGLVVAVVGNLIHALLMADREDEARACHQNLTDMVQVLSTVDDPIFQFLSAVSAAAAA